MYINSYGFAKITDPCSIFSVYRSLFMKTRQLSQGNTSKSLVSTCSSSFQRTVKLPLMYQYEIAKNKHNVHAIGYIIRANNATWKLTALRQRYVISRYYSFNVIVMTRLVLKKVLLSINITNCTQLFKQKFGKC